MKKKKGCTTPEVQKCLHCEKPECDCLYITKPHISELYALLYAGMISPQAIANHIHNKGKRFGKGAKKNARKED